MSAEPAHRPVVVIACRVFESSLCKWLGATPITFLDQGLHDTPKKLTRALQAALEALPEPALVVIGYGLCGNGLHGLQSGRHTLIVPRADDCISLYLGSQAARRAQLEADPGVYFLTSGWLDGANNPMSNYSKHLATFGEEQANWLLQTMYGHYNRLVFIAGNQAELEAYRPRAQAVARFMQERLGWAYEERLGTEAYLQRLLAAPGNTLPLGDDFLLVPPGGQVSQEMFIAW
jgi:hypothetical protein